jgi:hypothetical protein
MDIIYVCTTYQTILSNKDIDSLITDHIVYLFLDHYPIKKHEKLQIRYLRLENFNASNGWLQNFYKNYFKILCSKSNLVDINVIEKLKILT